MLLIAIVNQGVQSPDRVRDHIAAAAAIAAVRATERHMCFTAKADRARTTIAGAGKYLGLIEKLHQRSSMPDCSRCRKSKKGNNASVIPLAKMAAVCVVRTRPTRQPRLLAQH